MSKHEEKVTKVWVGVEDLKQDAEFLQSQESEFPESHIPTKEDDDNRGPSRRDFLKYVGFGLGAATIAGCEAPINKALPYVVKPEQIVPGVATYYASAFVKGGDVVPVLVKTREGRPIKVEGNPQASLTGRNGKAGTNARTQASVLELYDTNRVRSAMKAAGDGKMQETSWAEIDAAVAALSSGDRIAIVTHTVNSPTLLKAIAQFKSKYPNTEHVQYDPFSSSALREAHRECNGGIPAFNFARAKCVVGIEADFLATWISPVQFAADYASNRKLNIADVKDAAAEAKKMSFHVQMESRMSVTGSNADHRILVKPSEQGAAVGLLYNKVKEALGLGGGGNAGSFAWGRAAELIDQTAKKLAAHKGQALVVCGINDVNVQLVVKAINEMLGAYGTTIDTTRPSLQRKGNDAQLRQFVEGMGQYKAVFVLDANPAFDIPGMGAKFAEGLKNVALSVSMAGSVDETAALCKFMAPDHHYLESWGDAEPRKGWFYFVQPTINPLFKTRAAGESFLVWAGSSAASVTTTATDSTATDSTKTTAVTAPAQGQAYFDFLKASWEQFYNANRASIAYATFQAFWDNSLREGLFEMDGAPVVTTETTTTPSDTTATTNGPVSDVSSALAALPQGGGGEWEISFYEHIYMGSGQHANNPWLQELPDPVSRITWDNYISIPIKWNGDNDYTTFNNLSDGDLVTVNVNGQAYTLPVFRMFGQMEGTMSIALGYGRTQTGMAGKNVGANLFPAVSFDKMWATSDAPAKQGKDSMFACVQMHHTYGLQNKNENGDIINVDEQVLGHRGFQGSLTNRSVFFQGSTSTLESDVKKLMKKREGYQYLNSKGLYPSRDEVYGLGHHWALAVDMNACIGCNACAVACIAENNVPVVGKYEVAKVHEMTWLRIDRYFYGEEETPNAAYMAMMCQHCDNAPCENVCPVNATNHSSEGLNQMAYNRCIGTRYCANNCPYKVRRFNWLDYTSADMFPSNEVDMNRGKEGAEYYTYMTDSLTRMVLNPDVTVRSRGVIEKCSFCVQRIQEGKLKAKVEGRPLEDGDVVSACMQACPTGAIVFGDRNDENSQVYKMMNDKRSYLALEEVNVRSSVTYMMKVMNHDENFKSLKGGKTTAPTTEEHHG